MKILLKRWMDSLNGQTFQLMTTIGGVEALRDYVFNCVTYYMGVPTVNVFENFTNPVAFVDATVSNEAPVIGTKKSVMMGTIRFVAQKDTGLRDCAMFERLMKQHLQEDGQHNDTFIDTVGMPMRVNYGNVDILKYKQTNEVVNEFFFQDLNILTILHHSREV